MLKKVVLSALLVLLPSLSSAQTPRFEILAFVDNQWTVIDSSGAIVRTLPIQPAVRPGSMSLDRDEKKLLLLVDNWQTWVYDFEAGTSQFLFQSNWNSASHWLPGSSTEIVYNQESGMLFKFNTLLGTSTLWQSNDTVGGRVLSRVQFGNGGHSAVMNIHYPAAGGMGVYYADVCQADASHALCNIRALAWPGNGSASWSDVAANGMLSSDGLKAVYIERHSTAGAAYVHNIATDARVALLHWSGNPEASGAIVGLYQDRYAVLAAQSISMPGGSAYYVCDIEAPGCTEIFTRPGNDSLTVAAVARSFGDTTPPVITSPGDITAEATGPDGAIVTFSVAATDDTDGDVAVVCAPASGSTFALGKTNVECEAQDAAGNESSRGFDITVGDTTAPTISGPGDLIAEATSPDGAIVNFSATAEDLVDGMVQVSCSPASGTTFPLGATTVTCNALDEAGNTATPYAFIVNVTDTTAPSIVTVVPSQNFLWPPNGEMTPVNVTVIATDIASATTQCRITDVQESAPLTDADWLITGNLAVQLRAKRPGQSAMTYTLAVICSDESGNSSQQTVSVVVPHDQGQ